MAERLLFAVFFTALTFCCCLTGIPALCAFGVVMGCIALGCWIFVARKIDGK
jgi:hypothetical protein